MYAALAAMEAKVRENSLLKVGFLETAKYPDGEYVAKIAWLQEFGATRIPARPYFRPMISAKSPDWGRMLGKALNATQFSLPDSFGLMGERIRDELIASIMAVNDPPLSPVTLMMRKIRSERGLGGAPLTGKDLREAVARVAAGESTAGVNDKPLQDTKVMVKSVSYEVQT